MKWPVCSSSLASMCAILILATPSMPLSAAEPNWPPVYRGTGPREAKLLRTLEEPTTMRDFNEVRFEEVVDYLRTLHEIPIVLDKTALEAINVTGESQVTINVPNASLRSGLQMLLGKIDPTLAFVIRDEVIVITTKDSANEREIGRVYDVSAILAPAATAEDLAKSLERNYPRKQQPPAKAAPKQPEGGAKDKADDDEPAAPSIAAHRQSLMVRGTEMQHEVVVKMLRRLKEQADAKRGKGT